MVSGRDARVNAEGDLVREVIKTLPMELFAQCRTLPLRGIVRGGCKYNSMSPQLPVDIHHSLTRSHFITLSRLRHFAATGLSSNRLPPALGTLPEH